MYLFFVAATAAAPQTVGVQSDEIIVTASREPVAAETAPVSSTLFTSEDIDAQGFQMAADLLRLSPGLSVSMSGPRGSQSQARIRGAEANHTLLFLDGIRINDPAAANEARFELLAADVLSRIEIVRGPQSALWGSEALGGVIAVETANPFTTKGLSAAAEYGSLDSFRGSGQFALQHGQFGFSGSAGWLQSDGMDSFGSGGERDGFRNGSAHLKAVVRPSASTELGLAGYWIEGESEFDGYDLLTFARADTLDHTKNRLGAVRAFAKADLKGWLLSADATYLSSANRNAVGEESLNSTFGERLTAGAQLSKTIQSHRFTIAAEHEAEDFRARDQVYFGGTSQDRSRNLLAFVGEWQADWTEYLSTGLAVRHDNFSAFEDATTFRSSALLRPMGNITLHLSYGEGIAQPSFYDLYGFFPDFFAGNPNLKPEKSAGWETGLRWNNGPHVIGITFFDASLESEIVDIFDATTFLSSTRNADGESRRRGIELDAGTSLGALGELRLNYTWLDADEQQFADDALVREVRRPRHSANAMLSGSSGPMSWGAALAYVGARRDMNFDVFPAQAVTLSDYVLASLRVAYRITPALEAYARVENGFDADYQDAFGYHTPGRMIHAGLRLRLGD